MGRIDELKVKFNHNPKMQKMLIAFMLVMFAEGSAEFLINVLTFDVMNVIIKVCWMFVFMMLMDSNKTNLNLRF